ncbi:MAG: TetR/AcrR family transcriptional regulator [Burkholderiales bacterium]
MGSAPNTGLNPAANGRARYDRRLAEILAHATRVFCDRGYDAASIRDISRATGTSLAGLYYYFRSKEELLYLIQKDAFETLIARLQRRLQAERDPVARLRAVIANHLGYFLEHREGMKVLSHEADTLKGPHQAEIAALKRRYYHACMAVVEQVRRARRLRGLNPRLALLSLFGMMNWIYTWHKPEVDPGAGALSDQMASIFLGGILSPRLTRMTRMTRKEREHEHHRIRRHGKAAAGKAAH